MLLANLSFFEHKTQTSNMKIQPYSQPGPGLPGTSSGTKPAKKLSWFLTTAGRRTTLGLGLLAGTAGFCLQYIPNTFLIDKYCSIYKMYKGIKEIEVEQKFVDLGDEVMEKLGFHKVDKKLYRYFTAYGFDTLHLGSAYSKYGVLVGVPSNFYFNSKADVDANKITVAGEPIQSKSEPEAKEKLIASLVLSDKAKAFALGVQIYEANTMKLYNDSIAPGASIGAYYALSTHFNNKLRGYARPLSFRVFLYTLLGTFVTGMYFFLRDLTTHMREKEADQKVGAISLELAEGGVEYYSKILERNKALRKLMGSKGESLFTFAGNANTLILTPNVPITQRLKACQDQLKKLIENPNLIEVNKAPEKATRRMAPMRMDDDAAKIQEETAKLNE